MICYRGIRAIKFEKWIPLEEYSEPVKRACVCGGCQQPTHYYCVCECGVKKILHVHKISRKTSSRCVLCIMKRNKKEYSKFRSKFIKTKPKDSSWDWIKEIYRDACEGLD